MDCADAVDAAAAAAAGCRRSGDLYGGGNILLKAKNVFKGLQVRRAPFVKDVTHLQLHCMFTEVVVQHWTAVQRT
jgi:hypothetical protein